MMSLASGDSDRGRSRRSAMAAMTGGLLLLAPWSFFHHSAMTAQLIQGPIQPSGLPLPPQHQGVRGIVQLLKGSQMPGPGVGARRAPPLTVRTRVWIFSGTNHRGNAGPRWSLQQARQSPELIGWVSTGKEGDYAVGLPAGSYTLMAELGNDLYLNRFSGDGSYASVQVVAGEWTDLPLINAEQAFF